MPFVAWCLAACLLAGPSSRPSSAGNVFRPSPMAVEASVAAKGQGAAETTPIRIGPILLAGYAQFDGVFPLGDHVALQNGTFRIRRARAYASADLSPNIGFMISGDASGSPALLDVYVTFRHLRAANIRAGQFIAPYSLERLISTRDLEVIDRAIDRFTPSRDMGVTVFNASPFRGGLVYSAAVINGTGQNAHDNNDAKDYVGRLAWRVPKLPSLALGGNAASGRQPEGRRTRWGADANFERGSYRVAAEYLHETHEEWGGQAAHGFYILARRRFRPAIARPDSYTAEAVLRVVSIRDPRERTAQGPVGERREVQAGANYYFLPNLRVMADMFVPTRRLLGAPRATLITRMQFVF